MTERIIIRLRTPEARETVVEDFRKKFGFREEKNEKQNNTQFMSLLFGEIDEEKLVEMINLRNPDVEVIRTRLFTIYPNND